MTAVPRGAPARWLLALVLLACSQAAAAAREPAPGPRVPLPGPAPAQGLAAAATGGAPALPVEIRRIELRQLGGQPSFALRSTEGSVTLTFGTRADELITHATLHLRYAYSPSLIPAQSHIKVLLNDELVGVAPITKEHAGSSVSHRVEIDPRFVADFNRLRLESVGHYALECEDPLNSALWTEVSGTSELELGVRPLVLQSDLARLPEPFFDKQDSKRLVLPFVFAAAPSQPALRAAGMTASWFGQLAAWRGARFPALLDRLPAGHAVVLAADDARPAFLDGQPPVQGPTLRIITNPADGSSKLLLILGRDAAELETAASALVLGTATLSGTEALVREVRLHAPSRPYDAPRWVRPDRPTKFGEMIDSPEELQALGHSPGPIRINLRVPPDLFTWRSSGVPVEIRYRHSARPAQAGPSKLDMAVNNELVRSFELTPPQPSAAARVRLPLMDDSLLLDTETARIPAFKLNSRNQLQFGFSFAVHREGSCRNAPLEAIRAVVDADSSVDFSGFPHYAALPHLGYFATAGYPFTKFADLSQTVVVLPERPTAFDIEAFLTLLGRMGESTGQPAVRFRLAGPDDEPMLKDADLLLIGALPQQTLLAKWNDHLPAVIAGSIRTVSRPAREASLLYDWFGFGTAPDPTVQAQVSVEGGGPLAALLGFESPLSPGRSVVAVTAVAPEHLGQALDALDNAGRVRAMRGSAVFVHPQKVESFLAGDVYHVGDLPPWTVVWFRLSSQPVLLAAMALVAVLVFVVALRRMLNAARARRIGRAGR